MSVESLHMNKEGNSVSLPLSEEDFNRLSRFIKGNYGIDLSEKSQLIAARLSGPIRQRGYHNFTDFINHLLQVKSDDEVHLVLNKLTTNYTFFMREQECLDYFRGTILPELVKRHQHDKTLSIWSAGCSSGEEPYNMTMYLYDYLGAQARHWDTRILASDISLQALTAARRGTYRLPDTIPEAWKEKYFVANRDGSFTVAPEVKKNVIFRTFNLMEPINFKAKFDLIFCRNVMIYFDQKTKDALVQRFYNATVPGGYLVISYSENLSPNTPYQRVATATYRK